MQKEKVMLYQCLSLLKNSKILTVKPERSFEEGTDTTKILRILRLKLTEKAKNRKVTSTIENPIRYQGTTKVRFMNCQISQ